MHISVFQKYGMHFKICDLIHVSHDHLQESCCFTTFTSILPGVVVVLRGISGRCERVRAGNISPAFWGCQGLDESCLNFSLCKMPCVNSCPWPKHSDLVRQTPGVAHPSTWGLGWQSAWVRLCNQSGLKYPRMNKTSCRFRRGTNTENSRKESSDGSTTVLRLAVFCHV